MMVEDLMDIKNSTQLSAIWHIKEEDAVASSERKSEYEFKTKSL